MNTLGEDPLLAGELLAQRTKGTQGQKVMASIKHFAGNEQETNRIGGNSQVDDRTLRELYLLPFEIAVEQGQPASVMCSYNRLNVDYACENSVLLTDILKKQWHFSGQVQSDWGATHSTAKAINAGLDEEEGSDSGPSYFGRVPALYALANHDITQERVDDMVRRKLYVMIESGVMDDPPHGGDKIDFDTARKFAQSVEEQSIVLLKNECQQLPVAAIKTETYSSHRFSRGCGSDVGRWIWRHHASGDRFIPRVRGLRVRRPQWLRVVEKSMVEDSCSHHKGDSGIVSREQSRVFWNKR